MDNSQDDENIEAEMVLPEDVPVTMPDLPARLVVSTTQQFKAFGDDTRERILRIIQHQPATAKQIANRLKIAPGTIGHHLQVLEEAGLAKVVARRLIRGIVAKYYTRTARIFEFQYPSEVKGSTSISLNIVTLARDEMVESLAGLPEDTVFQESGFPHARLSEERLKVYNKRVRQLIDDFLNEPLDPDGNIYGLSVALFLAPPYAQVSAATELSPATETIAISNSTEKLLE